MRRGRGGERKGLVITARHRLFDRSYYSLRGVQSLLMFPRREATFKPVLITRTPRARNYEVEKQGEEVCAAGEFVFPARFVPLCPNAIAIFARFASSLGGGGGGGGGGEGRETRGTRWRRGEGGHGFGSAERALKRCTRCVQSVL